MGIRLIAFDLDGTLLDDEKRLSERNRRALEACADRGICPVPCTGRIKKGIPPEVSALRGIRYAITMNGAVAEDLAEDRVLFRHPLRKETALAVAALAEDCPGIMYDAYVDGKGISEARFYDHLDEFGIPPQLQKMVRETRQTVPGIMEYIRGKDRVVDKITMFFPDQERRTQMRRMLARFSDVIVSSSVPNNLEINDRGAQKGTALLELAAVLGIDRREIMAFGDSENDDSMIREAGVGVVMENGDEHLKASADYVTASNNESGVARALEKLILSGEQRTT